ncbi:MAG: Small heat shock protein IbpB [Mycoplasmataceae bacterium]|nr:MAG: Small heat shock protein IbpB [Mycoplasmataceae bacterium]
MKRKNLIRTLNEFNPLRRSILDDLIFPFENTFLPEINRNLMLNSFNSELKEDNSNYYVKAELPGFEKENIDINIDNNKISIHAEKKEEIEEDNFRYEFSEINYGSFSRTFSFSTPVNSENVKASFKNGILHLVIPKLISSEKTSKINIE